MIEFWVSFMMAWEDERDRDGFWNDNSVKIILRFEWWEKFLIKREKTVAQSMEGITRENRVQILTQTYFLCNLRMIDDNLMTIVILY